MVIDVSQAVEHAHPHALEFLRQDCTNVTDFFSKKGVEVMDMRALFNFVTDPTITDDNTEAYLAAIQAKMAADSAAPVSAAGLFGRLFFFPVLVAT